MKLDITGYSVRMFYGVMSIKKVEKYGTTAE